MFTRIVPPRTKITHYSSPWTGAVVNVVSFLVIAFKTFIKLAPMHLVGMEVGSGGGCKGVKTTRELTDGKHPWYVGSAKQFIELKSFMILFIAVFNSKCYSPTVTQQKYSIFTSWS